MENITTPIDDNDPQFVKNLLESFLNSRKNAKGRLLFGMLAGSYAFNLNVETSDKDYFAVYTADTYSTLSLNLPSDTVDSHDPDVSCHEVSKFCSMMFKGNPKVIEPLYCTKYCYITEEWEKLKEIRNQFLTQTTVNQYIGYALAQIHELDKGKGLERAPKKYYHCIRILQDAERIASGGDPLVWLDGENRDFLMKVRRNELPIPELRKLVDETVKRIDELKKALPLTTDPQDLSDWLVYVRRKGIVETSIIEEIKEEKVINDKEEELKLRVLKVLKDNNVINDDDVVDVLCCIPSGSNVHLGNTLDDIDFDKSNPIDYIAIYASSTDAAVSLNRPINYLDEENGIEVKKKVSYASGLVILEVEHAIVQLSRGCFRLWEVLHTDKGITTDLPMYESKEWLKLKEIREDFFSQTMVRNASGIAKGQLKKPTPKGLYHALRLLIEAKALCNYKSMNDKEEKKKISPIIRIQEGDMYDLLLKAKKATEVDIELVEKAEEWFKEVIKNVSSLPKKMDTSKTNEWLKEIRSKRWKQYK